METFFRDLRYGVRSLLKRPAFTAIALIALTLGIGANTAIFSPVNAVLLRPLPFPDPDRLVWMWGNIRGGSNRASTSPPEFLDYRAQNNTFNFPQSAELWVPINFDAGPGMKQRKAYFLRPTGKLKAGVTLAQAQADSDAVARRLEQQWPPANAGRF